MKIRLTSILVSPEGPEGLELVLEPTTVAVFEDTCGNFIQLYQV